MQTAIIATRPLVITAPDGRTAYVEIKDGQLVHGGDLPTDEAARIFMEAIASKLLPKPLDMVLHCPECGMQHVDAPDPEQGWTNPPHRSHKCGACGCVWRPADVLTNGVKAIGTRGKADTYPREDVWSDWVAPSGVLYVNKNCSECKQAPNMLQGTCCKDGTSLGHLAANPVGGWKR